MIYDNLFIFNVILHPYVPTVHKDSVYKDQILHSVGYMPVSQNIWSAHFKGPAGQIFNI